MKIVGQHKSLCFDWHSGALFRTYALIYVQVSISYVPGVYTYTKMIDEYLCTYIHIHMYAYMYIYHKWSHTEVVEMVGCNERDKEGERQTERERVWEVANHE